MGLFKISPFRQLHDRGMSETFAGRSRPPAQPANLVFATPFQFAHVANTARRGASNVEPFRALHRNAREIRRMTNKNFRWRPGGIDDIGIARASDPFRLGQKRTVFQNVFDCFQVAF